MNITVKGNGVYMEGQDKEFYVLKQNKPFIRIYLDYGQSVDLKYSDAYRVARFDDPLGIESIEEQ